MYRGRFAPSPTGPLHFGSLVAALASCLEARRNDGKWLVRIEDVDSSRSRSEATTAILSTLDALGFHPDEPVIYQSTRSAIYQSELNRIAPHTYSCSCSRKEVEESGAGRYPGTCRKGPLPNKPTRAIRVRVDSKLICFNDPLQGRSCSNLEEDLGDFPLFQTTTGIYSYHLAVVVDDEAQAVTDVVRGADLLDSTARQIHLQRLLGYRSLRYLHIPVATGRDGEKLSKQNFAPALEPAEASRLICEGLNFLGQDVPASVTCQSLAKVWDWANSNWSAERIPACQKLPAP